MHWLVEEYNRRQGWKRTKFMRSSKLLQAAMRPRPMLAILLVVLAGAALLLAADIAVRIIPSTTDIKVGVLTSIIGVPFFLYLIVRERRSLGGGLS